MTGDLIRQDNTFIGAGAPVTGDEITGNDAAYPLNTFYIDKTNGASYVRTGVGKVTGDWTQIGGGGSSYLVYTPLLSQSGTDAPVATVLENTLGGTVVWARNDVGFYEGTTNIPTANIDNVWMPLAFGGVGNNYCFIPLSDYGAINGYLMISLYPGASFVTITVEVVDEAFAYVDLSSLNNGGKLRLPELRYYNA